MLLRNRTLIWSASGLFAAGAVSGLSAQALTGHVEAPTAAAVAPTLPPATLPPATLPNYRAIVARNESAVVGITTEGAVRTALQQPDSDNPAAGTDEDSPFSPFFRALPEPPAHSVHAQGSGFIISADGLLLTNAHVVEGARTVTVKLADHREFKAKVLGADPSSDIAVLKIDAHDLHPVDLGDSDRLAVGDYVLAIGEPFGLEETATAGIVSAKGRSLPGDGYVPFIQTDAAVNPGNSGGPLFDASGRVVGINAQIYSNSGGYQGVSFAIPINVAVRVEDQIVKTGTVTHARLGVSVQTLDQALARSFRLQSPNGALVASVEPDSAAAHAGLKVGDVILRFNGTPIIDAGQLSAQVAAAAPGDTVALELWRDAQPISLKATIGAAPQLTAARADDAAAGQGRLGLNLRPLRPEEREAAGLDAGLLVEHAQGSAAEAGVQAGDVVLAVDGTPVKTVPQLRQLVDAHPKELALLVQRGHSRLFIPVELG